MSNVVVYNIGTVVAAMRAAGKETPVYLYGHRIELHKRLVSKEAKKTFKYPLIALNMDFPEEIEGGVARLTLNIAILHSSTVDRTSEQRYATVIVPVLMPLYERFFTELRNSGLFTWPNLGYKPKHTKIDRPFWGVTGSEGNEGNFFSDPLDAIEIVDLEINQPLKNC